MFLASQMEEIKQGEVTIDEATAVACKRKRPKTAAPNAVVGVASSGSHA
jgi:hypothetical protein